ncbi:hypothetical protein SBDP1_590034 [Syntrophobacter sp. SbD1]|nr:hypothetical protein SBDP1_590034 [Syntrophobacter sp. SbD1]
MPLHRSMELALINTLNYHEACGLPEDSTEATFLRSPESPLESHDSSYVP